MALRRCGGCKEVWWLKGGVVAHGRCGSSTEVCCLSSSHKTCSKGPEFESGSTLAHGSHLGWYLFAGCTLVEGDSNKKITKNDQGSAQKIKEIMKFTYKNLLGDELFRSPSCHGAVCIESYSNTVV